MQASPCNPTVSSSVRLWHHLSYLHCACRRCFDSSLLIPYLLLSSYSTSLKRVLYHTISLKVFSTLLATSMLAPLSMSSFAISACPFRAAHMSAVLQSWCIKIYHIIRCTHRYGILHQMALWSSTSLLQDTLNQVKLVVIVVRNNNHSYNHNHNKNHHLPV